MRTQKTAFRWTLPISILLLSMCVLFSSIYEVSCRERYAAHKRLSSKRSSSKTGPKARELTFARRQQIMREYAAATAGQVTDRLKREASRNERTSDADEEADVGTRNVGKREKLEKRAAWWYTSMENLPETSKPRGTHVYYVVNYVTFSWCRSHYFDDSEASTMIFQDTASIDNRTICVIEEDI